MRWRTGWGLLFGSLLFSALALATAWFDYQTAAAFSRSARVATGEVIVSDCWDVLCRGGPDIQVAYTDPAGLRVVGQLACYDRHYRVGETVTVVYSDEPDAAGVVVLPPAQKAASQFRGSAGRWAGAGAAGLLLAGLAWAFPANLRRLDRRDAARATKSPA